MQVLIEPIGTVDINATNIASTGILPALSMRETNGTTVNIAAQNDSIPTTPLLNSGDILLTIEVVVVIAVLGGGVFFAKRMRK